jgi:hypothetical protein
MIKRMQFTFSIDTSPISFPATSSSSYTFSGEGPRRHNITLCFRRTDTAMKARWFVDVHASVAWSLHGCAVGEST